LWNASAQNEDGVCQFSPTRATNQLPQQRPLNEPSQLEYSDVKPTYRSIFVESSVKINPDTLPIFDVFHIFRMSEADGKPFLKWTWLGRLNRLNFGGHQSYLWNG